MVHSQPCMISWVPAGRILQPHTVPTDLQRPGIINFSYMLLSNILYGSTSVIQHSANI